MSAGILGLVLGTLAAIALTGALFADDGSTSGRDTAENCAALGVILGAGAILALLVAGAIRFVELV